MKLHRGSVIFPLKLKDFVYAQEDKGAAPQMGVELIDAGGRPLYRGHVQQGAREEAQQLKTRLEEGRLGLQAELPRSKGAWWDSLNVERPYQVLFGIASLLIMGMIVSTVLGASGWTLLLGGAGLSVLFGGLTVLDEVRENRLMDDKAHPPFRLQGNMLVQENQEDDAVPEVVASVEILGGWGSQAGCFQRPIVETDLEGEEISRIIEVTREARAHKDALERGENSIEKSNNPPRTLAS